MKAPENQNIENSPEPGQDADALSQAFFRDSNVADVQQGPSDSFPVIVKKLAWFILPVILLLVLLDLMLRWQLPPEALLPYMQKELACYTLKVERLAGGPAPDLLFLGSSRIRDAAVPTYYESDIVKRRTSNHR